MKELPFRYTIHEQNLVRLNLAEGVEPVTAFYPISGELSADILALQGRIEALEADLAAANESLSRRAADDLGRKVLDLEAENAALRRELQGVPGEGLVSEPLPTADEVYGIFTPCPCGEPHDDGWCLKGRVIYDDAR